MSSVDDIIPLFTSLGFSEEANESSKNKKLTQDLITITDESSKATISDAKKLLLRKLLSVITGPARPALPYITNAVISGKLERDIQVKAAVKYCEEHPTDIPESEFNEACGVGAVVDKETVDKVVSSVINSNKEKLDKERYSAATTVLIQVKKSPELRWAEPKEVKDAFDQQILAYLGPKDDRDLKPKKKEKKPKNNTTKVAQNIEKPAAPTYEPATLDSMLTQGDISKLHKPGGNKQIKPELMEEHLKFSKGKVITRFPPEPNGYLHIGHVKAININFGYAKVHGGSCNLRYDDTNPEAEEQEYIDSILETVKWLGFTPKNIFYASDYFDQLYELAIKLIKKGLGYVCHCTGEEIKKQRGGEERGPRYACAHRDRPISESLEEFENMKNGKYKEGEATLRMKMDLTDGNPCMWDLVAYRVLYTPHHRTGDKWCIYPSYDFAHCLCDSIENISHSLCTVEFILARQSYYWLCDAVEVYKPVQWEYGRLNITNTVLSKRKLLKVRDEGVIDSLDDPRLYTLPALRRRGVPPESINAFVRELGVSTSTTVIEVARLEKHIRDYLNEYAPRLMAVLEPLKVTLENLPESHFEEIELPFKPRDPSFGSHKVPFTRTLYIDASDFREDITPNYYRLAPGKTVGLLNVPFPITCTEIKKDADGNVVELVCRYEDGKDGKKASKPKAYIQWVADCPERNSPIRLNEVRIFKDLFNHSNPQSKEHVPGGWLSDVNRNSLEVYKNAIAEVGLWDVIKKNIPENKNERLIYYDGARVQFIRIGYFSVDKDSLFPDSFAPEHRGSAKIVLNRTIALKEDVNK
ncbi:Glutaminyl-tRNA synthetase [Mycoemilia scoparia]|uniref:glutamine--tRNA ligase n=1 Tax=Mycoemilia scoparia TaxID=417184 RepID=A0A9W8DSA5_9FUNG|nr:Glutaminyl-tRNA synthetase [Mycoemilia scoparia]